MVSLPLVSVRGALNLSSPDEFVALVTIKPKNMSSENYVIRNQNSVHFLTFTVIDWIDIFTRANYKEEIVASLDFCQRNKGLVLYAWCLMTNHLHMVCKADEPYHLTLIVRDFKRFTANNLLSKIQNEPESRRNWILSAFRNAGRYDNRVKKFHFWQDGCHPIEMINNQLIEQRINYVHENPVRAMIVANPEDYLFSSARNYASLPAVIDVEVVD